MIQVETAADYTWMEPDDATIMHDVQQALAEMIAEGVVPRTCAEADALLTSACRRLGIVDTSAAGVLEICAWCGRVFNREYGGEYADPTDHADLDEELGQPLPAGLYYNNYCDLECLRAHVERAA